MSPGLQLLGSLQASEVKDFLSLSLEESYFVTQAEKKAYTFVKEHVSTYGQFPSPEVLTLHEIELPPAPDPVEYYVDLLKDRWTHRSIKKMLLEAQELLNNGNLKGAKDKLLEDIVAINCTLKKSQIIDFAGSGMTIVSDEYDRTSMGLNDTGLFFGWPTLDLMTGGLIGGDVVGFVGRPGMGKTYMMLYGALSSWRAGAVPLFISMEMKPMAIIQRLAAMHTSVPISGLKEGELSSYNLSKLLAGLAGANEEDRPFYVVDGNLMSTPQDVLLMCRQLRPSVVFIDAAYLLGSVNKKLGKFERVSENVEFIKSHIAEGLNIPAVLSYQINREGGKKSAKGKDGKKGKASLEDIAYSDAIGQICSCVLGLFEDENVETLNSRLVSILKGRNGEIGEFRINWLFDDHGPNYMDFTQIHDDQAYKINPNYF